MNELQILNINNTDYEICDKNARIDINTIGNKEVLLDVSLNNTYIDASKSLQLSLNITKGTILNG